jgi:hypothetical protein
MIRCTTIALMAAATAVMAVDTAAAQSRVQTGLLTCRGARTTGFIVGSVRHLSCVFRPDFGGSYPYHGTVRKYGLDIGVSRRSAIAWGVFAPTRQIGPSDLAGHYAGVSAGAAVGVGASANALVGGSRNSIALQPVSVEGQTGVNVAVGVADLELRYGR